MLALTSVVALSLVPSNFNVKDALATVTDRLRINLQGRTHRFDDAAMVPTLDGHLTPQEYKKDLHLATTDTRAWCADRCLATGHCDVVEDLWEMSTKEIMKFCDECADLEGCELDEQVMAYDY